MLFPSAGHHGQLEARERARGARHAAHDRPAGRAAAARSSTSCPDRSPGAGQRPAGRLRRTRSRSARATTAGAARPRSGPVSETADQGESPLTQPSVLQGIEIAVEGVPCLNTPVPFDPSFGPGTPGLRGPDADVPAARASVSRPWVGCGWRARAGGTSTCAGATPSRWRSLRDVTVQFVGRRGVLATLRFDQNRNRLTLLRRGSRRSLTAGRSGRLKVGGVTVRSRDA